MHFFLTLQSNLNRNLIKNVKRTNSTMEDEKLLPLLQEGDKDAFSSIFHKYYQPLCGYAYQYIGFEDVEEVVQDLMLWIWQNHESLFIRSSLQSYLYKAVYLRCLTRIEQNAAKRRMEAVYRERMKNDGVLLPEDFQAEELLKRINEAIDRLPEKYREAFVLHRFKDCSYKEIARQLNVSAKTVDYRIQQALKLLRDDLKDYFPLFLLLFA